MSSVYFGNDNHQTWIKAPSTGLGVSNRGWTVETQLLTGKTHVDRSQASHKRFTMNWLGSMNDEENTLNIVKDFADGMYGDGPFFWNDPYATKSNLLSPAWAAPFISIDSDWDSIFPENAAITKSVVTTQSISASVGVNNYSYPINTAKYEIPSTALIESNKFTFYIPDGYTLWVGVHGYKTASGKALLKPYLNGVAGTPVEITPLGVNTLSRLNTSISSNAASKVEFYLAKTTTAAFTFHLTGIMAQLLPSGQAPATGNFISGRGTNGLEFATIPEIEYYSSAINNGQIGMSATFVEV